MKIAKIIGMVSLFFIITSSAQARNYERNYNCGRYEVRCERVWVPSRCIRVWVPAQWGTCYDHCGRRYRGIVRQGFYKNQRRSGYYKTVRRKVWVNH